MEILFDLGVALAIGLLIGIERGWQVRDAPEGSRIAGIRTFGLVGLLGGLWALIGSTLGTALLAVAFAALATLMIFAHLQDVRKTQDMGVTTVIAALVTFALGALALLGQPLVAAAGAVVTTTLLSLKPTLHRWLQTLEAQQLFAGIKLLLISVVVLPVLPDQGYGPWQALNPFEIWWMVVLIAAISFAGYLAMRLVGLHRGLLLTGLFGGLASSTATTLNLARLAGPPQFNRTLAAAILLACTLMFPRMAILIAIVSPALLPSVTLPLAAMGLASVLTAMVFARQGRATLTEVEFPLRNPMEIIPALTFGGLLALILVLGKAVLEWFGEGGLYVLAAVSAIADVDAVTLTFARLAEDGAAAPALAGAILMAALANTLFKAIIAIVVSRGALQREILVGFGLALGAGIAASLMR